MTTALQLITRSLLDLEVLGEGDVPSAQQESDSLAYLNDLIDSWSIEGLTLYTVTKDQLTVTGSASYTMGSGGTFNVSRPNQVLSAFFTLNNIDYPLDIINREQYESISDKAVTATIPDRIYVEYSYPYATVYLYPVPSTGTLNTESYKNLSSIATAGTTISLPSAYERALRLNLSVELMPMYGKRDDMIVAMAAKAKSDIERLNLVNRPIKVGLGIPPSYGVSDIYRGWNGRN